MDLFYFLTVPLVILLFLIYLSKRRHPKYPPGSRGLPLLGNVHQMGMRPFLALRKWKLQYGNIFSIKLGLDDAIVINDPKLIKELFSDFAASGRFQNHVVMEIGGGNFGVANTEKDSWHAQRIFVIRKLREMGFSKSSMEGMILSEAQGIVKRLGENKDMPIPTESLFVDAIINSLWNLVSGESNDGGDSDGKESKLLVLKNFRNAVQNSVKTGLMFAPFLKLIAPDMSGWTRLKNASSALHQMCEGSIAGHEATLDTRSPGDLIDHYLTEMEKTKDEQSSYFKDRGMNNLKATVTDLIMAGSETTSATLLWTLLYLSFHQSVQRKMIEEIRKVVGNARSPSLQDRPTHTVIISNIDSCQNDPQYWKDPESFQPERFLSEDGTKVVPNDSLMPFSVGKRHCIGETFAKDTIFLFVTSIFQKFQVEPDPECPKPDLETEGGFVNLPKPFRVVVKGL